MGAVSGDSSHVSGEGEESGWASPWLCLNTSNELPRLFLCPSSSSGNMFIFERKQQISAARLLAHSFQHITDANGELVVLYLIIKRDTVTVKKCSLCCKKKVQKFLLFNSSCFFFSSVSMLDLRCIFIVFSILLSFCSLAL